MTEPKVLTGNKRPVVQPGMCRRCGMLPQMSPPELEALCLAVQEANGICCYPPCSCWDGRETDAPTFENSCLVELLWLADGILTTDRWKEADREVVYKNVLVAPSRLLEDSAAIALWLKMMIERKNPHVD